MCVCVSVCVPRCSSRHSCNIRHNGLRELNYKINFLKILLKRKE